MTGEDLFCCPLITGQVMSISPFYALKNGLVKLLLAVSDLGKKISEVIYFFAEKGR